MNIGYVPNFAKKLNDVLWLGLPIENMLKYARKQQKIVKSLNDIASYGTCPDCGYVMPFDMHHIKPLWAWSLQTLIDVLPDHEFDLYRIGLLTLSGEINVLGGHQKDNLRTLCHFCHAKADAAADIVWRDYFTEHHPVVFGTRDIKRINDLIARNNP